MATKAESYRAGKQIAALESAMATLREEAPFLVAFVFALAVLPYCAVAAAVYWTLRLCGAPI